MTPKLVRPIYPQPKKNKLQRPDENQEPSSDFDDDGSELVIPLAKNDAASTLIEGADPIGENRKCAHKAAR